MKRLSSVVIALTMISTLGLAAEVEKSDRARLDRIQQILSADVPRVLCLDDKVATGAQPTGDAYSKAAANGFHSVLNLRTRREAIDLDRERAQVEKAKMRFFNIPVDSSAPRPEQADEFIRLLKEPANQPMLITCASANRVGAFMTIYRVVVEGWSEDKALAEGKKIGLRSDSLQKFALDYIARHRAKDR
jgi:protein tyrosine phosphatase (PTP) superfamily phosphohydrolase (DUF442 family)